MRIEQYISYLTKNLEQSLDRRDGFKRLLGALSEKAQNSELLSDHNLFILHNSYLHVSLSQRILLWVIYPTNLQQEFESIIIRGAYDLKLWRSKELTSYTCDMATSPCVSEPDFIFWPSSVTQPLSCTKGFICLWQNPASDQL